MDLARASPRRRRAGGFRDLPAAISIAELGASRNARTHLASLLPTRLRHTQPGGGVEAEGAVRLDAGAAEGVAGDERGTVDKAATASLREQMRADRPAQLPTFDMGPPIEEILARALEETGLPAPTAPRPL